MKKLKGIISILLIVAMMTVFAPMSKAVNIEDIGFINRAAKATYTVTGTNTVKIPITRYDKAKYDSNCREFAEMVYQKIWGQNFCSYRGTDDDLLRNIPTGSARAITAENTKKFITAAKLGSVIRIAEIVDGNDSQGKYLHSQILIQKDEKGFTIYESNVTVDGILGSRTKYFTWQQYATYWAQWKYFKYIKYPGAPALSGTTPAPTPTYTSITTGNYTLKNASNGKLLEVAGGVDADKTNIQVGAAANSAKQRFYISPASKGYKMRPLSSSSRLVNAWGSAPANGANVNIYKDCNENSQWWYFEKVSGGYVIRLAYNSSLVLTLSSSDNVTVATYSSGNKKQIWSLEAVANPQPPKPTVTEENLSMNYKSTKDLSGFKSIKTSDRSVVSVSGNTLSAVGTGSADITATRTNGDICVYHVKISYTWWQWMIVIFLFGWTWY